MRPRAAALALAAAILAAPAAADAAVVDAGPIKARFRAQPPALVVTDAGGRTLLRARFGGRRTALRVRRSGPGVLALRLRAGSGRPSIGFARGRRELLSGFGERSNAVDQAGRQVENYVSDGPYVERDRAIAGAIVPAFGRRDRDDDTYYPVPWLLSSRGYGVLLDNDEASRFDLRRRGRWEARADATELSLRVFAGPRPADALRRFTAATGRQPPPPAPWAYGPWFQTGQPNVIAARRGGGDREEVPRRRRPRVGGGDPDALPALRRPARAGGLRAGAHAAVPRGRPRAPRRTSTRTCAPPTSPCTTRRWPPARSSSGPMAVPSRSRPSSAAGARAASRSSRWPSSTSRPAPRPRSTRGSCARRSTRARTASWRTSASTPRPSRARPTARPPARIHNRYPRDYHCALQRMTRGYGRPVVRFQRSGWTGTARCSVNVWGGDPTTVWGFDGLRSAVTQALTIGMSGVARWGSDIGGYNSFGAERAALARAARPLDPARGGVRPDAHEAVGDRPARVRAAAGVRPGDRCRSGGATRSSTRSCCRTSRRRTPSTGRPECRSCGTGCSPTPATRARSAPTTSSSSARTCSRRRCCGPGARRRSLYLPRGRWVDLWRSGRYVARDGSLRLGGARLLARPPARSRSPPRATSCRCSCARARCCRSCPPTWTRSRRTPARGWCDSPTGATACSCSPSRAGAPSRAWARAASGSCRSRATGAGRSPCAGSAHAATGSRRRSGRSGARSRPRRVLLAGRPLARSAWSYDRRRGVLRVAFRCRSARLAVEA